MLVERLEMFPVECVVRGYITGSGWKDYQARGAVCGIELPAGLQESEQLPEPIFTPATKAEIGDHDENVDFDRAAEILGDRGLLEELRRLSLAIYSAARRARARARDHPRRHQVRVRPRRRRRRSCSATRCSRRTRRASGRPTATSPAAGQPSLRQAVRARLGDRLGLGQVAARRRELPHDVVAAHARAVREAYERIAGEPFAAWLETRAAGRR